MITLTAKRLATAKAHCALAGFAVVDGGEGGWIVCRWGRTHYCATLEALEAFAQRVGEA